MRLRLPFTRDRSPHRPPENRTVRVLLLGRVETAEMRPVLAAVEREAAGASIERAENVENAAAVAAKHHWSPDLVVICQNRPDEFSSADVGRLLALFPLARWICCYGLWCESDGRNRAIWPLAVRVPASRAASRLRRELRVVRGETPPLPLTAARSEVFGCDASAPWPEWSGAVSVSVRSPDAELRRWLVDLLQAAGYTVVTDKHDRPAAVLWDADPWDAERAAELHVFRERNPGVAVVALLGLPHPQDAAELRELGAGLVGKPAMQADILGALETALRGGGPVEPAPGNLASAQPARATG